MGFLIKYFTSRSGKTFLHIAILATGGFCRDLQIRVSGIQCELVSKLSLKGSRRLIPAVQISAIE
jgi:hypothetical protein